MVQPIPQGYNTVSCHLVVPNSVQALEFYRKAFGAEETFRMPGPDGQSTVHAEMRLGNSMVMLSDENPQWAQKSPQTLGGTSVSLHLYLEDVDAVFNRAVEAGCEVIMPLQDMFWGDRFGELKDPFGHVWSLATRKEDVSWEEMQRRAAEVFSQGG